MPKRILLYGCLLLVATAFAVHAPSFANDWTLDDLPVIVNNPDILSIGNFLDNTYPGRPLRELTYLVDHALFGLEPAGYHLQNIGWHALNGCLLLLLAVSLRLGWGPALCAALVFLVHPLQVEVVANISHRKDSLALAFCLLSVICYLRALGEEARPYWWLAGAILGGLLALTAKQHAIVLPLIWLVAESLQPTGRIFLLRIWKVIAGLAGLVTVGGVGWLVWGGGSQAFYQEMVTSLVKFNVYPDCNLGLYYRTVFKSWAFMGGKLVWPVNLAVEYTYPVPPSWLDPWVLAGVLGFSALITALVLMWRRAPVAAFGLSWFLLLWLPAANLWPIAYFSADRYLYAPMAGFCLVLAVLLERYWHVRRYLLMACALALVGCLALTWRQNLVWRDSLSLWTQAVKVSPMAPYALNNLGEVYFRLGNDSQALEYLRRADEVNDNLMATKLNLALIYEKSGQKSLAVRYFVRFVEMNRMSGEFPEMAEKVRRHLKRDYGVFF